MTPCGQTGETGDARRALTLFKQLLPDLTRVQAIGRLSPARRAATLLAVAKHLETVANDDALDLFETLAVQLVARSGREGGDKDRLRQLPVLAEAWASLALAVGVLFEADESLSLRQVWEAIEAQVPRAEPNTVHQSPFVGATAAPPPGWTNR